MRIIKSGHIDIYTEFFGDKNNPAILLISGAMASARFWPDSMCTKLAQVGYFVIRYDHRDMGLSSGVDYAKNPYNLHDLTKDAVAVLDDYGIEQAHIIGHSMGGAIAQLLALDYQQRVLSLVLISTAVLAQVQQTDKEKEVLERAWQIMAHNKPTMRFEESVKGFMVSYEYLHGTLPPDHGMTEKFIRDMYERTQPEHLQWFEKYSAGLEPLHNHVKAQQYVPDRIAELSKIKVPVLVLQGEKDPLIFERVVRTYCAHVLPQSSMVVIPGMGHMVLQQNLWAEIERLIITYLERVRCK